MNASISCSGRRIDPVQKYIDRFRERSHSKPEKKSVNSTSTPLPQLELPFWPDKVRAVPNGFLRSALFGVVANGRRRFLKAERIAAVEGVEITYTGEQLDQKDRTVWESVLQAVRLQQLGSQCRVTSYALLKLMNLTDSGKNRATLQTRIERLRANAITMKQGNRTYVGGLVNEAFRDEDTQEWVIVLNPKIHILWGDDQFTQIEWVVRRALDGQPLAQWLHGFYASHAKPFPMKVETLHRLCGSEATLLTDFAKTLRKALDAVKTVSKAHGEGFGYIIRSGLVHVEKKAQGAQRRHLAKKAKKAVRK